MEHRKSEPTQAVPADNQRTATVRAHYDRVAAEYDGLEASLERGTYSRWRRGLWSQVHGPRILEVGVGTGKNIAYYPKEGTVTAIDFSPKMLARARQRAAARQTPVDLRLMDAAHLTFPDHTFDTVIATFVYGSVPDPIRALREVARVVKPGGTILLLEYVRPTGALGILVDLLNPLVFQIYGANINRHTADNVREAGLTIEDCESFWKGMVQRIVARRSPHDHAAATMQPLPDPTVSPTGGEHRER